MNAYQRSHARAQARCYRRHRDWRYDPGTLSHWLRYWLPALIARRRDEPR
jgi:hypothetical protein